VAELQVLIGAWHAFPTFGILAGFGILVGVAYTLRALQKAFFADESDVAPAQVPVHGDHRLEAISVPERLGALILIGTSLVIGLFPSILLKVIVPSFSSSLFEGLRKVGGIR
jgi:NADH-quinone oxidoreductase subunit M